MKKFLVDLLVCPGCLPKERPLELTARSVADGDIIDGHLCCLKCRRRFPIREGIATLLPDPGAGATGGQWKYEEAATVNSYLWSHFADLLGDPDASDAYAVWAAELARDKSIACDAGCAVGRLTFELAEHGGMAVGCDLSLAFIRIARKLVQQRQITFSLPLEGHLRETFRLVLPGRWQGVDVEFVVADALALPFARESFDQVASLNLIDRVNHPLAHLYEMNRVAQSAGATFLLSDPYSWNMANAPVERWLGGREQGPYSGRGETNVRAILQGRDGVLHPPWSISREGRVCWKIRSHANHFELIRSSYLVAER